MTRVLFRNSVVFLSIILANGSHAQAIKGWQPIRILGITYPKEGQFGGIEGSVEAKCSIRTDGTVADITILRGHFFLARAVKENLAKWRFSRIRESDLQDEETIIKFTFKLEGDCDSHRGCKQQFWFDYPDQITVISERPITNSDKVP